MKSISEYITEQETGTLNKNMPLEQAYAEMSVATSLMTAYCECAAVVEFCEESSATSYFGESAMDKLKAAGASVGKFFKSVATFLKNLVRNISNAVAADRIEKTIGIWKAAYGPDGMDETVTVSLPDIEKLLDDINDFTEFISGVEKVDFEDEDEDDWRKRMPGYIDDIKSEEGLAKRYGVKEQEITVSEFITFLRKIKDSKANIKASKILKKLDTSIGISVNKETGEPEVSPNMIKDIKLLTNSFVKVYDAFFKTISNVLYHGAKHAKKNFDKEHKNAAEDFIKEERKRKVTNESFYFL